MHYCPTAYITTSWVTVDSVGSRTREVIDPVGLCDALFLAGAHQGQILPSRSRVMDARVGIQYTVYSRLNVVKIVTIVLKSH